MSPSSLRASRRLRRSLAVVVLLSVGTAPAVAWAAPAASTAAEGSGRAKSSSTPARRPTTPASIWSPPPPSRRPIASRTKSAILFSTAQAYRRQYFVDREPAKLKRAVDLYRQYVGEVAQGGRRDDAVQHLSDLEPLLARVEDEQRRSGKGRSETWPPCPRPPAS